MKAKGEKVGLGRKVGQTAVQWVLDTNGLALVLVPCPLLAWATRGYKALVDPKELAGGGFLPIKVPSAGQQDLS